MLRFVLLFALPLFACSKGPELSALETPAVEIEMTQPEVEAVPARRALLPSGQHVIETPEGPITVVIRRSENPDAPLIIYSGGTAFRISAYGTAITEKLSPYGDLLMWDYPAIAVSRGTPDFDDFAKLQSAAMQINANLDQFRRAGQPTIYWGHSLGGFVSANLVSEDSDAKAIVLENTASSAPAVAEVLGGRGAGALLRFAIPQEVFDFSIPDQLAGRDIDVLVIGGARDRVLPVQLSRDLADALTDSRYIEYPKSNHFDAGFQPAFNTDIRAFLETIDD